MIRLKSRCLLITIVLLASFTGHGYACSCGGPPSNLTTLRAVAEWEIQQAPVIFEGTVEKIEVRDWFSNLEPGKTVKLTEGGVRVTFSNTRLYRGGNREQFMVQTGFGGGDCGYHFKSGSRYLVYAWVDNSGNLSTGICSGTRPLDSAGTALKVLRGEPAAAEDLADRHAQQQKPTTETHISNRRVCGKISFPKGISSRPANIFFWRASEDASPMPEEHTETENDGSFCQDWMAPGKYLVEAISKASDSDAFAYGGYYPGVPARAQAQTIEVRENDELVQTDFSLVDQPLHSVRGYLRGVSETGDSPIMVMLLNDPFDVVHAIEPIPLGPHGVFEFSGVPNGHYFALAVIKDDEADSVTCVSKVEVNVDSDVSGLTLQFVAKR